MSPDYFVNDVPDRSDVTPIIPSFQWIKDEKILNLNSRITFWADSFRAD